MLDPTLTESDITALRSHELTYNFIQDVQAHTAGAICVFLGTTRAERRTDGVELVALDYEAYEAMAVEQMKELAKRVRQKWPVEKVVIVHRVGRVKVGEPSVLIAVSTPHRAESFAACQWLIDTLKAEVTVWKKEVWADEGSSWKEGSVPREGAKTRSNSE